MNATFKRATRHQVPLKIGITGPSGSGKTTAALELVQGLTDGPIAFLDTENGSASLYSHLATFDVLDMVPPYQVRKFTDAIDAAVQSGYKALIIDSASAEWSELLAEKEAMDARGGNSFANWGSITKKHEDFLKAIRNAPIHLIVCLRAKQEHVQDKDASGRTTIRKVGMAAIQRDGMEYELTTVFDIAMDHNAKASKDRTGLFEGRIEPVTKKTGREIAAWLSGGGVLAPVEEPAPTFEAPKAEPKTVGEAILQMPPPTPTAITAEAEAFVDSVCDEPAPRPAIDTKSSPIPHITKEQWEELTLWTNQKTGLSVQLRYYCEKKGWMTPAAQGFNTLAASCWEQLSNQIQNRSEAFIAHLDANFPATRPTPKAPAAEPTTTAKGRKSRAT